jgi:hypothetical protein
MMHQKPQQVWSIVLAVVWSIESVSAARDIHSVPLGLALYGATFAVFAASAARLTLGWRRGFTDPLTSAAMFAFDLSALTLISLCAASDAVRHRSPVPDTAVAVLLAWVVFGSPGTRNREAAMRLFGEKSKALLAKLTTPYVRRRRRPTTSPPLRPESLSWKRS